MSITVFLQQQFLQCAFEVRPMALYKFAYYYYYYHYYYIAVNDIMNRTFLNNVFLAGQHHKGRKPIIQHGAACASGS